MQTEEKPRLVVVVDTEEQFDWSAPFDRNATAVTHMRAIGAFQAICDAHGVRPTYVIDYPIASTAESATILRSIQSRGACEIGAHLHPWVNPPFEEEVCAFNSYPGNLPGELERAKLHALLETISSRVGTRPVCYKAGRYGFGPNTAELLHELGMRVDLSVAAAFDLGADGGPDYTHSPARPCWLDEPGGLLSVPATGAFVGWCASPHLYRATRAVPHLPLTGLAARLGACERLFLSPEGYEHRDCVRLTRFLLARGVRTFQYSLHSPSVEPGHTAYVRSPADLEKFFARISRYFEFFLGELGGVSVTPTELHTSFSKSPTTVPA